MPCLWLIFKDHLFTSRAFMALMTVPFTLMYVYTGGLLRFTAVPEVSRKYFLQLKSLGVRQEHDVRIKLVLNGTSRIYCCIIDLPNMFQQVSFTLCNFTILYFVTS
jgi:hypothetical protein